ncbi:MAG: pseudaminic acid synthase [Leptospira sp.]|nr:pseudaminic acid synthase [Leptospira sp.]
MKRKKFKIPTESDPVFIIAELSANHNNNFDLAVKTIEAMAESGADAVKVQTYTADSLTLNVDNEFIKPIQSGPWKGRRLYELFKEGSLPYEWYPKLIEVAEKNELIFFASPFDKEAVDFLDDLDVQLYKVASPEITDIPLIQCIASKGKPVILSTGMASEEDIELAVKTMRENGSNDIALLKCTSEYPARLSDANLATLPDLQKKFNCIVGVSDHTDGFIVPSASVVLGARIIEKHFILDRSLGGLDSFFSMEPLEFAFMVETVRKTQETIGTIDYTLKESNKARRRSIFASRDIRKGEPITDENVKVIRPGVGLHPKFFNDILWKKAAKDIPFGTPIFWDSII